MPPQQCEGAFRFLQSQDCVRMNETKTELIFYPQIFSNLSLPTSGDSCELSPQCCASLAEAQQWQYPQSPSSPASSLPMTTGSLDREICFPGASSVSAVGRRLLLWIFAHQEQILILAGAPASQTAQPGMLSPDSNCQTLLPSPTAHSMWWRQKISTLPSFLKLSLFSP